MVFFYFSLFIRLFYFLLFFLYFLKNSFCFPSVLLCILFSCIFLIQSRLDIFSVFYFWKETHTLNCLVFFHRWVWELFVLSLFAKGKTPAFKARQQVQHTINYSPAVVDLAVALPHNMLSSCFVSLGIFSLVQKLTLRLDELFCTTDFLQHEKYKYNMYIYHMLMHMHAVYVNILYLYFYVEFDGVFSFSLFTSSGMSAYSLSVSKSPIYRCALICYRTLICPITQSPCAYGANVYLYW